MCIASTRTSPLREVLLTSSNMVPHKDQSSQFTVAASRDDARLRGGGRPGDALIGVTTRMKSLVSTNTHSDTKSENKQKQQLIYRYM